MDIRESLLLQNDIMDMDRKFKSFHKDWDKLVNSRTNKYKEGYEDGKTDGYHEAEKYMMDLILSEDILGHKGLDSDGKFCEVIGITIKKTK